MSEEPRLNCERCCTAELIKLVREQTHLKSRNDYLRNQLRGVVPPFTPELVQSDEIAWGARLGCEETTLLALAVKLVNQETTKENILRGTLLSQVNTGSTSDEPAVRVIEVEGQHCAKSKAKYRDLKRCMEIVLQVG